MSFITGDGWKRIGEESIKTSGKAAQAGWASHFVNVARSYRDMGDEKGVAEAHAAINNILDGMGLKSRTDSPEKNKEMNHG